MTAIRIGLCLVIVATLPSCASSRPVDVVSRVSHDQQEQEREPTIEQEPSGNTRTDEPLEAPSSSERACLDREATVSIAGSQRGPWHQRELDGGTLIDARNAAWSGVGEDPVRVGGGAGICWHGGRIDGRYGADFTWDDAHETAAFSIYGPDLTVTDLRIHNEGDLVNLKAEASDFTLARIHLSQGRDDCIENDYAHSGLLEDALLDGCYTALSARPSSDREDDGRDNEWVIRRSLIRLEPMEQVYKGESPGHGKFFKWDKQGRGPRLSLHDNVFLAEQPPQSGDLGVPEDYLASCSNNVVVWLGAGEYPGWLPESCFTITSDRTLWDDAVADWTAAFEERREPSIPVQLG